MNRTIIDNWNSVVGKDNLVYHLGDFTFGKDNYMFDMVFDKLNGKIVLIEGNHDQLTRKNKHKFYAYYDQYHEIKINGVDITLCHYPLLTWNKKHHNAIMLHGHCHYNLPVTRKEGKELGKILDVGVDGNNFMPYSFNDIMTIMDKKPMGVDNVLFKDHHGK